MADATETAKTPPTKAAFRVAFLIEIAGKINESVMCPIDGTICRGRWDRKNLIGKSVDGGFNAMPNLPGICFVLNSAKRLVRRFDPLADPANEKILKRAQRVWHNESGVKMAGVKPKVWAEADDSVLKTFTFWARRLLDAGHAEVLKGAVPEWPDIKKMPGVIQLHAYDKVAGLQRGVPDELIRYEKPVKDESGDEDFGGFDEELPDAVIGGRGDDE